MTRHNVAPRLRRIRPSRTGDSERAARSRITGVFRKQSSLFSNERRQPGDNKVCTITNTARPAISTTLSNVTLTLGGKAYDTALLRNVTAGAGGTVTYTVHSQSECRDAALFNSQVNVTNGTVPNSADFTPSAPGTYYWQAIYGGDPNNLGATSACSSEVLIVTKATPTVTTTTEDGTGTAVSSVPVGTPATDSAAVSGVSGVAVPAGSVAFSFFGNGTCQGDFASNTFQMMVLSGGVAGPTTAQKPAAAGAYSFEAHYSGDSNYVDVIGPCESLTVTRAAPTLSTMLSADTVTAGTVVHDSAKLTNATGDAGGTVTYAVLSKSDCSDSAIFTSEVSVSKGAVPDSASFTPRAVGTYYWQATNSGDGNNQGVVSACGSETLAVTVGPTAGFTVTPSATRATDDVPFSITLTAQDAEGNATPTYAGTVHFTSIDTAATLPADYQFTPGDGGTHTFTDVVLRTLSGQTISAADSANSAITGSSSTIAVGKGAAPAVTGLKPAFVPPAGGTAVVITGSGFANATAVDFGANNPSPHFHVDSDAQITAVSPRTATAAMVQVTVTADGQISSPNSPADQFLFATVAVLGVSPATGGPYTTVTIDGFGLTATGTQVALIFHLGQHANSRAPEAEEGQPAPDGATTAMLTDGAAATACTTSTCRVAATNVHCSADGTSCTAMVPAVPTDPTTRKPFPAGAMADVQATVGQAQSPLIAGTTQFTYQPPTLSSLNPATGPSGATVTLTGTGFTDKTTTTASFVFHSSGSGKDVIAPAAVLSCSGGTTCQVTAPAPPTDPYTRKPFPLGTPAQVHVTVGGMDSNALTFSYAKPTVTQVDPNQGTGGAKGTQVTITGTGFGTKTNTKVTFVFHAAGKLDRLATAQLVDCPNNTNSA